MILNPCKDCNFMIIISEEKSCGDCTANEYYSTMFGVGVGRQW